MTKHCTGLTKVAMGLTALAALLALTACATGTARNPGTEADKVADARVGEASAQLPKYRIRDWSVVDDHTIIVMAHDGTRYRAETIGPCVGLNFASRLAFANRGGFQQVDRFSSILLSDGTRCQFATFDKLAPPESKALDSYEKSKEAEPTKDASETDASGNGGAEKPK